ncbi:TIGR03767 family metallophosphoesterase [Nocardioides sp.]|uniref:TIGR03767 family metallophosphoesterase n=1 Tax=Nocardioides sp. TaxID=35761 RepID=UPI003D10FDE1
MVTLTRRKVVQYGSLSVGGLVAVRLLREQLPSPPVAPSGTTLESTIIPTRAPGYRLLTTGPAQPTTLRTELAGAAADRARRRTGLASVVQLTDLHITDVQNPLRFEYLDRVCGTGHRPQELLGTHGATALVQRVNSLRVGPFTGRPIDAVITTGDNTDNQGGLELEWLLSILAGGDLHPTSGNPDVFEGVAACGLADFWQPECASADRYKTHGFPFVPGLLAAATAPFTSPGLDAPWLLTMGNHDVAALGTLGPDPAIAQWYAGDRKIFAARSDVALRLATRLCARTPAGGDLDGLNAQLEAIAGRGETRAVTSDPRRAPFTAREYVEALGDPRFAGAGPVGHGYDASADGSRLYFIHWLSEHVLAISLDTTNQAGGADGSLGSTQLSWLVQQLEAHPRAYVVVFSHHPSHRMTNLAPDPRDPCEPRHSGDEVLDVLHRHPQVLAWVNGHLHHNRITPRRHSDPRRSFWEINTASHVDAPQQGRVIEVARNGDRTLSLFTTMFDAESPAVSPYDDLSRTGLASLYRELAYNDSGFIDRRGAQRDGNTELLLVDPLP